MADNFAQREYSRNAHFLVPGLMPGALHRQPAGMATQHHIHLRAHRKARGFTQEQIANTLGVRNNTVSGWETGNRTVSLEDLEKLASMYGVHPAALLMAPAEGEQAEAMRAASEVARRLPSEAVTEWISLGRRLAKDISD